MNFDPIDFLMRDHENRRILDRHREQEIYTVKARIGNHERRIDLLELWQQSLQRQIRRWPFVVVPIAIVLLNAAPQETIKIAVEILKALL